MNTRYILQWQNAAYDKYAVTIEIVTGISRIIKNTD